MAIRNKEEILTSIKQHFEGDTSDSTLAFLEDVSDTLNDYEAQAHDNTDWHAKYDENDKAWREKYKERFFSQPVEETEPNVDTGNNQPKVLRFEDLFTTQ